MPERPYMTIWHTATTRIIIMLCGSVLNLFFHNIYPQLTTLELQYVSPNLLNCEDLELAVPGTYEPNQPIIHIKKVFASLNVITSKQRPRKLVIQG